MKDIKVYELEDLKIIELLKLKDSVVMKQIELFSREIRETLSLSKVSELEDKLKTLRAKND